MLCLKNAAVKVCVLPGGPSLKRTNHRYPPGSRLSFVSHTTPIFNSLSTPPLPLQVKKMAEKTEKPLPSPGFNAAEVVTDLRTTFRSGRTRSLEWRQAQLRGLQRFAEENKEELYDALMKDLGKPRAEACIEMAAPEIMKGLLKKLPRLMKSQKVSVPFFLKPASAEVRPEPLGVCLIISPWNFPIVLALEPLAGAIAAGNCAVLKPSEISTTVSGLFARLLPKYVDPEAVRVVEGGPAVATALLEQRWDHIFYTGGTEVGRIVMAAAAKHLTPVVLELGGKNPVIVDSSADIKVVATNVAKGKGVNMGQVCMSPDYVLVQEEKADALVAELKKAFTSFYGEGVNQQKSPDLARIVSTRHWDRINGLLSEKGVADKIVFGGFRDRNDKFIETTVVLNPPLESAIMKEEIFGPVLVIVTVKSLDEAIEFVNTRPKPLALYPFTKNKGAKERILNETSSGGVTVNDTMMHRAAEDLPFGGVGESGMGAYSGKATFTTFCHMKSILHKPHAPLPELALPPYTERKIKILDAALAGKVFVLLLLVIGLKK
eukprot:TRINITY_DN2082_c0_g4_i2.p1 TRINITY_DN2082_c0_g4~~TRINITY_DN2082_c0_g4_i2.p1  ORF type:complete len:546 (+),score=114.14 TRINITY_DN2082_c0_g4_i2:93-1730(+)